MNVFIALKGTQFLNFFLLLQSNSRFSTVFRLSHCKPMEPCEQHILRSADDI